MMPEVHKYIFGTICDHRSLLYKFKYGTDAPPIITLVFEYERINT